jgi:pimeloyl-ACP methyl ester carboxylesterase
MSLAAIQTIFGDVRPNPNQWNPIIYIRHGICSSHTHFILLQQYLASIFPSATIDNVTYDWHDSVLVNGARLANEILRGPHNRPLVLIGHSMGGLLCRVTNAIFQEPQKFDFLASNLAPQLTYKQADLAEIATYRFSNAVMPTPTVVITLATPNSGAMLHGQVSGIPALLKSALNLFPPTNLESVADLTTDRLFRFLQKFSSMTPMLSISGSKGNRFARGSGAVTSWLGKMGLRIEMPNDLIVEDRSVDLQYSILPNEMIHMGSAKYLHARCYLDCADVWHSNIYDDQNARELLADCLKRC